MRIKYEWFIRRVSVPFEPEEGMTLNMIINTTRGPGEVILEAGKVVDPGVPEFPDFDEWNW